MSEVVFLVHLSSWTGWDSLVWQYPPLNAEWRGSSGGLGQDRKEEVRSNKPKGEAGHVSMPSQLRWKSSLSLYRRQGRQQFRKTSEGKAQDVPQSSKVIYSHKHSPKAKASLQESGGLFPWKVMAWLCTPGTGYSFILLLANKWKKKGDLRGWVHTKSPLNAKCLVSVLQVGIQLHAHRHSMAALETGPGKEGQERCFLHS